MLDLLTEPRELYRLASKRARKVLNRAFFIKIYIDSGPTITGDETTEPPTLMHEIQNHTPAHSDRGWNNDGYVDLMAACSNALDALKSTQATLRRLASDPLIADEPDLGSVA